MPTQSRDASRTCGKNGLSLHSRTKAGRQRGGSTAILLSQDQCPATGARADSPSAQSMSPQPEKAFVSDNKKVFGADKAWTSFEEAKFAITILQLGQ